MQNPQTRRANAILEQGLEEGIKATYGNPARSEPHAYQEQ
jgi:hypothetical protein